MFESMHMVYWMGVVEDRLDPMFLGRVRVRIYGYHNENPVELPTEDLPWAMVVQPITSAAVSGVGTSPVGPVDGTTVVGFFADGESGQQPMILGAIAGQPIRKPVKKYGFRDTEETLKDRPYPSEPFPRESYIGESEVNRLARHQNIDKTVVKTKDDSRDISVPMAFGGVWDQPKIPYNAEYPYNHVMESESGHILEFDDTKDNERVHLFHRAGTYVEVDKHGTMVRRIVGDGFEIYERNNKVHIKGRCHVTVDGDCNLYVLNNCDVEVDGTLRAHAHGNIEFKAGKKIIMSSQDGIDVHTDSGININANQNINVRSFRNININSVLKTTISSPITEVAFLKVNGLAITPIPPRPPIINPPSTTSKKSPSEKIFPELGVADKSPDVPIIPLVPVTEADPLV